MPHKTYLFTILISFSAFTAAFAQTSHKTTKKHNKPKTRLPSYTFDGWWDYCGRETGCDDKKMDCNSLFIYSEKSNQSFFEFCGNFSVKCTNVYHHDTLYAYVLSSKALPSHGKKQAVHLPKPKSLFAKCVVTRYKRTKGIDEVHGEIKVILTQSKLLRTLNNDVEIEGSAILIPKNYRRDGMGDYPDDISMPH